MGRVPGWTCGDRSESNGKRADEHLVLETAVSPDLSGGIGPPPGDRKEVPLASGPIYQSCAPGTLAEGRAPAEFPRPPGNRGSSHPDYALSMSVVRRSKRRTPPARP